MEIEKILLIDDDADVRRIAGLVLDRIGHFRVALAASGAEGVALADREPPDVILLDWMMPDLDGEETLLRLRAQERTARLPVIFLTASATPADVARCLELGAIGVIRKPFDPMGLAGEIRRLAEVRS